MSIRYPYTRSTAKLPTENPDTANPIPKELPMPSSKSLVVIALVLVASLLTACSTNSALEYNLLSSRSDRLIVQLNNGLVVIAQEIPTADVASVHCYVKTGSIYEGKYNGLGLSHFLEHLASGGSTTTRTEAENNAILGKIGASTNAFTSLDTVGYYINTSSDYTPEAVDLISDWMQHSKLVPKEFEREQQVIRREFDMGRGEPDRIFWKATLLTRFDLHPARHPIIGYLDEFNKTTRDQLYDFYKTMYVPNNMVFVVAGNIDKEKVVDQVASLWKNSKRGKLPTVTFPKEPPVTRPRFKTVEADIDRPRIRMVWPGTKLADKHDFELDLLAQILGQGEVSRLVQTVRNEKRLVTSIDAYNVSFAWGEGMFGVDCVVEAEKMEDAKKAILVEVDRLLKDGITRDELERAKRKTVTSVVYSAQTAHDTADRLGRDFITTGDPDYLNNYAKQIEKITPEQILTSARTLLKHERLMTITMMPRKSKGKIPFQKRPADSKPGMVPTTPGPTIINLDNDTLVQRFHAQQKDTKSIASADVSSMKMHRLPNGMRVIIQKNSRLPIVAMQWYQLGGSLADTPGKEGVAGTMARLLIKGAGDNSADEIAATLERLGARINASAGNSTFSVASQCLSGDWPTVLSLMSDIITKPTFTPAEWDKLKPRLLAAIDTQNDVWYQQLRNEFRAAYFGDHPWATPSLGKRSVVETITSDQLRKFHVDHFAASDSVLAIFGDVDEKQALAQATKLFASLPAKAKVPFKPLSPPAVNPGYKVVESKKPLVAVQIGFGPGITRDNPDYAPLLVMNRVMSSFPVGRFDQALRGSGEGLVYAVGAGTMTGIKPGYWAVMFNTQSATLEKALSASLNEIKRIRTEPIDAKTLARARTKVLVTEATSQQSASQRAANAAISELFGVGYNASDKFINQIRNTTAQDIQRVAKKYLDKPVGLILTNIKPETARLPPLK